MDSVQRRLLHDARTGEGDGKGDEVDRQLELEETLDVIVNVTSPLGSLDDGNEVIVLDEDISGFLAGFSTGNTHSESDISSSECGSIVGTISSDSDGVTQVSESSDHQVLVFGTASGHYDESFSELLEFLGVLDDLLGLTVLSLLDESTAGIVECLSDHGERGVGPVLLFDDLGLNSDSDGSTNVISSNHSDGNSSLSDSLNGSGNFSSDSIFNTDDADKSVVSSELDVLNTSRVRGIGFNLLFFVVLLTALALLQVLVGNSDSAEGVISVASNLLLDVFSGGIVHGDDLTFSIHHLVTLSEDNFGSSLHLSSDSVAFNTVAGRERSHSLSAGSEFERVKTLGLGTVLFSLFRNDSGLLGDVASLNHVDHGFISGRGVVKRHVTADTFSELLDQIFVETHFAEVLFSRFLHSLLGSFIDDEVDTVFSLFDSDGGCNIQVLSGVDLDDLHNVVGKSTSLVGADVIYTSHNFARRKLLDIALDLQHLDDGVG